MTVRRFCDCCHNEAMVDYTEKGHKAEILVNGRRKVLLKTEVEFVASDGDLCADCLATALYDAAFQLAPNALVQRRLEQLQPHTEETKKRPPRSAA